MFKMNLKLKGDKSERNTYMEVKKIVSTEIGKMNENHKQVGYYKYMIRVDQPAELMLTCLKKRAL